VENGTLRSAKEGTASKERMMEQKSTIMGQPGAKKKTGRGRKETVTELMTAR
jgi:hypothetical protein